MKGGGGRERWRGWRVGPGCRKTGRHNVRARMQEHACARRHTHTHRHTNTHTHTLAQTDRHTTTASTATKARLAYLTSHIVKRQLKFERAFLSSDISGRSPNKDAFGIEKLSMNLPKPAIYFFSSREHDTGS